MPGDEDVAREVGNSMNDEEYLWDRSGERDGEVARQEAVLGRLKYEPDRGQSRRMAWRVGLVAVAAGVALVLMWPGARQSSWRLGEVALYAGDLVEEGRVLSASVGSLEVEKGSRLRLKGGNHFSLERGVMHALVWAPPHEFVVDTPAAKAIDLGCQYTLRVGEDGGGVLQVETGWVALAAARREAFVPAGAECRTRAGRGPGTPHYSDATVAMKAAVLRWDAGDASVLAVLVAESRPKDGLTLWHLIPQTEGEARRLVVERLGGYVPLQDRDGILRGDRKSLDKAWEALGLGGADWWRIWRQTI